MQSSSLNMHSASAARSTGRKRVLSLGLVGSLHVVAIYALLTSFLPSQHHAPDEPIRFIPETPEKPTPPQPRANVEKTFVDPTAPTARAPDVDIARDTGPTLFVERGDPKPPAHPPTAVESIASTHTIPAYPSMAIRLSQQGTVTLRLSVASDGSVGDARVETSSGSSYLDEAAIAWVKLHWRYKPATQDGAAVPSSTLAAIRFDLKNAR